MILRSEIRNIGNQVKMIVLFGVSGIYIPIALERRFGKSWQIFGLKEKATAKSRKQTQDFAAAL